MTDSDKSSPFEGLGVVLLIVLGVLLVLAVGGFWFVSGMNIE